MGGWGADSFENDIALDWLGLFCSASNKAGLLLGVLETISGAVDEYTDAAKCSSGIAAAEVVASLKKAPNSNFPEDAKECVSEAGITPDARLVELALKAVARVRADSELKELWDDSENPDEWYSALGNLEARLKL